MGVRPVATCYRSRGYYHLMTVADAQAHYYRSFTGAVVAAAATGCLRACVCYRLYSCVCRSAPRQRSNVLAALQFVRDSRLVYIVCFVHVCRAIACFFFVYIFIVVIIILIIALLLLYVYLSRLTNQNHIFENTYQCAVR